MLLICYHSQSGTGFSLAAAAWKGARSEQPDARLCRMVDTGAPEVAVARGVLLVFAENSGRIAGGAKDFLDRIFYPLAGRELTLPYGLLVSAGNDGRGAVEEARRILRGIPFTEATEPRIVRGLPTSQDQQEVRDLGAGLAAGVAMGIF